MTAIDQPDEMLRFVEQLSAIGVALSCLELLRFPGPLQADGLMNWNVSRLRSGLYLLPLAERFLNCAFSYPATLVVTALRLVAALLLATGGVDGPAAVAFVWVVAVSGIAFSMRCPYGLDGADQLYTLTFCGLAVARTAGGETAAQLFLWWLAAHVAIAYLTSGVAKLISPAWRSGLAISGVISTAMYGFPALAAWLRPRPRMCQVIALGVITGEIAFPMCLVLSLPLTVALLLSGIVFHLLAAFTMGLNSFLWAFVATYPALLYTNSSIRLGLTGVI